jgi:hypothetical protein
VTKTQDGQRWSEDLVKRVGAAAKKARGPRSAKWLSDRTAELGYRISPTVIAKLDSGHRGNVLSVPELLILAAALEIPPALLLFPAFPDGKVELLPGRIADTSRAVGWLSGASAMETGSSNEGVELVEAVARLASIDDDLFRLRGMMEVATMKPVVAESTQRVIRDYEERFAATMARIDKSKAALWSDSSNRSVDE